MTYIIDFGQTEWYTFLLQISGLIFIVHRSISMTPGYKWVTCPACKGTGEKGACGWCGGAGEVTNTDPDGPNLPSLQWNWRRTRDLPVLLWQG